MVGTESVLANEGWHTGGLTSSFIGGGDSFFVRAYCGKLANFAD